MVTLFTKREAPDLASLAIADREDVRTARASEATAQAAVEAATSALRECWREQGGNEGALSGPNTQDAITAMEASQREPGLRRDEIRLKLVYERAVRLRESVESAARTECKAARVAGLKERVRALFDALADVVPANDALAAFEAETAALLGRADAFDSHSWSTEFAGDEHRESVLEFRKRRAVEAGLL
jgi:hypothetical protein